MNSVDIQEQEAHVRHKWKISTIAFFAFLYLFSVIRLVRVFDLQDIATIDRFLEAGLYFLMLASVYYFAYKKFGNKWLVVMLVFLGLNKLSDLSVLFRYFNSFSIVYSGVGIALYVWWLKNSLELIKVNRRIQFLRSDSAELVRMELGSAIATEDFDKVYHKVVSRFPEHAPIITDWYNKLKSSQK